VDYWPEFAVAAVALTLLVIVLAFSLRRRPRASSTLLGIFLWVMLANVAWHVGVSVYTRSIAPGAVTAVVLLLPLYSFYLRRLFRIGRASAA